MLLIPRGFRDLRAGSIAMRTVALHHTSIGCGPIAFASPLHPFSAKIVATHHSKGNNGCRCYYNRRMSGDDQIQR